MSLAPISQSRVWCRRSRISFSTSRCMCGMPTLVVWCSWPMRTCAAIPTSPGRVRRVISSASGCSRPIPPRSRRAERSPSCLEPRRVPPQMIGHEGGDEIIAVVVAALTPEREANAGLLACCVQEFGLELLGQELIGIAIVDQKLGKLGAVLDQRDGVVVAPGLLVVAEIASKRLDTPGHA